ncbi:MAG: cytidine deaminase [Thermovenabulum sp.]|uniref:cytidine deaminase n=1 Tax=Thermovenabulum sp. TaxID=3100335 RepID=UPI003C7DD277
MIGINDLNTKERELVLEAIRAKNNAYAPYSKFKVGAAVSTKNGKVYNGCNIENASFGLTVCAERVALFKAYSEGEREIDVIAVTADVDEPVSPCGACRQVILELAKGARILLSNKDGSKILATKPEELLPYGFVL